MESTQQKVERLQAELDSLNAQSPRNEAAVNQTANALDEAKKELEQEMATMVRIQDATEQAAFFLDNLEFDGLTMRDLTVGETEYQLLRIAVQTQIINQAEEFSKQIAQIQVEENTQQARLRQQFDELQAKYNEDTKQVNTDRETIATLQAQLDQSQRETADYIGKLKNATDEITRLESQVDDLRKEIAVGARNAYKVTDVEQAQQIKQLTDQIKASKIKVTDMVFKDYTHINYTATLMQDLPSEGKKFGDQIEFPSIFKSKYVEVTAAEAEQFRAERASNQEVVSDSALGNEATANVTPEGDFPEVPIATALDVPGEVSVAVPTPELGGQGFSFEERLAALEAHCFGHVKQAVA